MLTFDLAGGTLDGKTGTITIEAYVGETIKLPGAPTKEGYTFKYWRGSEHAAGAEYVVPEGGHAFTAEWEQNASESADSGKSNTNAKAAIPATGDPLASLPIALTAAAAIAAACLAFAALRLRRDGEA